MKSIQDETIYEETIKNSRFIGIALKITTEEEFKKNLIEIKKKYPGANHYAFGYILKGNTLPVERCSDDGEVKKTAGRPILSIMRGRDLVNSAVVVIRYFGGIKLGVGGLVRAYSHVAAETIKKAIVVDYVKMVIKKATLSYKALKDFEWQVKKDGGEIIEKKYGEKIEVTWQHPDTGADSG